MTPATALRIARRNVTSNGIAILETYGNNRIETPLHFGLHERYQLAEARRRYAERLLKCEATS